MLLKLLISFIYYFVSLLVFNCEKKGNSVTKNCSFGIEAQN